MTDAGALSAGLARYAAGDPAGAAALFREALAAAPADADALRLTGLSLVRAGEVAAGLPFLARAVARAPRAPLAHLHHGIGLLESGQPARAAARFRRAATLDAAMPAAWINFSAALLALGQARAARAAARRALRIAPGQPDALHALARGHAALGDLDAAGHALAAVLAAEPGRAEGWIDLGLLHARRGEMLAAQRAMTKAVALVPGHPVASANLAAFAVITGDAVESMDLLREILTRHPGCTAARLNLANTLLLDREATACLALLEGPVPPGREGAFWRAHQALAMLLTGRTRDAARALDAIPAPYGDAEILIVGRRMQLAWMTGDAAACERLASRLEVLIGDAGASLFEHRVIAAFELARLRADQGRRADAFAKWQAGHRLMAQIQPFSRRGFAAFVEAQVERFGVARLAAAGHAPADDAPDPTPVFIIGLPRSGTTLTEQILSAHAQVHGAGERHAVHRLLGGFGAAALLPGSVHRLADLPGRDLVTARRAFLEALRAEAPAARYVIDKMPGNALQVGFLAELLPGARFILCRRDLRDTGLSIFQHRFFGHHPYAHALEDLGFFMARHERLTTHWQAALPGRMIEIRLEDWVADLPATLARLEAFLDLAHDPACLRFHESRRRVRTASAAQVRRPINARGVGRWRAYADELAPMIQALG